ncbi:Protein Star [Armadillidium vulgare]|nr:Protein Star [Armadillidium vulgare]
MTCQFEEKRKLILVKNGTFIEAGAFDGETFSNTLNLEKEFGWSGLLWGARTDIVKDPSYARKTVLSHVKCYPLYTLMVATNLTTVDFFSLDVEGVEMKILETIPWNDVTIKTFLIENDLIPEGKDFLKKYMETKGYEITMLNISENSYLFAG